ncbi:lateral tail fiber protein [Escherichia phage Oekolampad]|uniref:Lateral tail fiber protein n=1 Tax=Escherichia phage Oekolampad TaxID=2851982 RepID=A0AAE8B7G9_9CAUD|nr:lateral tail fiber protein [Escherichia phage Oekolampad]QXV82993.1 lateral tail fiber protein [Escherichia phage Oekolampad]
MAAGTLSVTNNSKAVVGVGTTFTAFKAGDFLTLVVGQVPYTVAIASIESATALTLVLPFDGPTATGLAWDGVKRDTMSLATMGVTVQAQKALRLMIADENNWRAIFGDAEEITVTLPNGQVMQGMSWGYLSSLLKEVDPVEMRNLQQQAAASEAAAQGFRNEAEGFKNDANTIKTQTSQLKADTQAIKDQTTQLKADTQAIKDQTNQIKTDTGVIRDEANTAKEDAQAARTAAQGFRNEAEQFANSVNPENLLAKANNLSDVADVAVARENIGVDRLTQNITSGETQIRTAAKNKWIFVKENGDWGGWDNANNKAMPLPIAFGGTGRGDNVAEFRQFKSNGDTQDGLIITQNGSGFGGVCWGDSADKVRWRMGINDAAGNFKLHSYDASGAYRDTFMEISGSGISGMVCHRDITVRPTATAPVLSFVLNNGKATVPAGNVRTMWDTVSIKSNLIYKYFEKGDGTGFTVNWPSSGGVIALQGTSGRDFKKDITDADVTEAVARIEQMRMVRYVYKDDVQERVRFGIIAEEAEEIAPQYIKHREETYDVEVDPETNAIIGGKTRDRPSVDVNPIVMDLMGCAQYAIAECKRLAAEVEDLKAEIAALKK